MNLRNLMGLYIVGLSLLHALSPVPSITFDFCLSLICLVGTLFFVRGCTTHVQFRNTDTAFGLVFLLGLLPLIFSPTSVGSQNMKYASIFFLVWLLNYWWVREWLGLAKISILDVSKFAATSALVLSACVYLEIVTSNLLGLYISDFIPFSISNFPQATILGSSFQRPRVFSSEAGFTSIAFECLLPVATIYLHQRRDKMLLFMCAVLPAYIALGSASSFLGFAIVLWTYSFLVRQASIGAWLLVAFIVVIAGFLYFTETGQYLYQEIIGRKLDILFTDPALSENEVFGRREAYTFGYHVLSNNFFGIGWGAISQANQDGARIYGQFVVSSGLISLFLEIAVATGILGFVITAGIFLSKLVGLARQKTYEAHAVYFSLLWVALHHVFVFEFWFPMIWFSLAVADLVLKNSQTSRKPMVRQLYRPRWN